MSQNPLSYEQSEINKIQCPLERVKAQEKFDKFYSDAFIMPLKEELTIFHPDGRVEKNGRFLSNKEIQEMIKKDIDELHAT